MAAGDKWSDALWELRFTWRALEDLGVPDQLPGAIEAVRKATSFAPMVVQFQRKRTVAPVGGERLKGVRDRDIRTLHGARKGFRAVTWYDEDHGVCWFLGFTSEHEYSYFEERGGNHELLPDRRDYIQLYAERDANWHLQHAATSLEELIDRARQTPNKVVRGVLSESLTCDVFAEVLIVEDPTAGTDIWISFSIDRGNTEAWLPPMFEAELIGAVELGHDAVERGRVTWRCSEFPAEGGDAVHYRPVDQSREIVVRFSVD